MASVAACQKMWTAMRGAVGASSIARASRSTSSGYAATHPLEDFAETFRFYVIRRGRLKELLAEIGRKGKGVAVFEKFLTLHYFLAELRQRARERNSGG